MSLIKFFLLFTVFSIIEVQVLFLLGKIFSFPFILVLILGTGFLGAFLIRKQGASQLKVFKNALSIDQVDIFLLESLLILIAAILLICPGIITDFIGFLFLIPFSRRIIASRLSQRLQNSMKQREQVFKEAKREQDIIIDIDD